MVKKAINGLKHYVRSSFFVQFWIFTLGAIVGLAVAEARHMNGEDYILAFPDVMSVEFRTDRVLTSLPLESRQTDAYRAFCGQQHPHMVYQDKPLIFFNGEVVPYTLKSGVQYSLYSVPDRWGNVTIVQINPCEDGTVEVGLFTAP